MCSSDLGGGFAMQAGDDLAMMIGQWRRYPHAALRQVAHQVQVKGQLLEAEFFKYRQHEFTVLGAEKEIAVFDAGGDALQRSDSANRKLLSPGNHFFQADGGEHCHKKNSMMRSAA